MWVTLFVAQSLDGRITRHEEPGDAFSSDADKAQFRAAMRSHDAWIMGGESFRWMSSQRAPGEPWRPGLRRVVWTRTPEAHAAEAVAGVLEFTAASPAEIVARLAGAGCRRCALLGGGQVYGAFLAAGLVDEVVVTVEPRVFGRGRPLTGEVAQDTRLRLVECAPLDDGGAVRLRYEVIKS
ncbi:MAG: dihydrofolate reductase family protein [Verrucomicrobiota bacterium]